MRARRGGGVLVLSAVVHVGLLAGLAHVLAPTRRHPDARGSERTEPTRVELVVAGEPVEVAFVTLPETPLEAPPAAVPEASPVDRVARRAAGASAAAIASATGGVASEHGAEPPGPPGPGSAHELMRMRGPGRANLTLDPVVAERLAASGRPLRDGARTSGKLRGTSGGGAEVNDAVTTMTVAPDGSVTLRDKPDIDIKVKLPIPSIDPEQIRRDLGKALTDWYADPLAQKRIGRTQDLTPHLQAAPGACDDWGALMCDDPEAPGLEKYVREQKQTGGSLLGGKLDITSYLHRKFVGDPHASRKLKLLDDTRDERAARGAQYRAQQLARAAELARRNLERLWREARDPLARKAALFELWDECPERRAGDADNDDPAREAGERARAMVIGWIRTHLPAGSAGAYTAEELAALSARRTSTQPFAPYEAPVAASAE